MPFCSKCGTELAEGAKYCPKCGAPVDITSIEPKREKRSKSKGKPLSSMTIIAIIVIVVVVIAGLLATVFLLGDFHPLGEIVGSGDLITKEEIFSDFTSVDTGSGFIVEISRSNSYEVLITADDNVMEHIEIRKSGDTLVIGVQWGYSFTSVTLKAKVTMPELDNLELSGGAQGKLEEFGSTNPISFELSGGSVLRGEFSTTQDAEFSLTGGSQIIDLDGDANDITIDASSGSQLNLSDFMVHNTDVELDGGSQATINLDGTLTADLSGGSTLYYYGDPSLDNIDTTGGSTISKK